MLGDFKRLATSDFMTLKLSGLLEFGEKATVSNISVVSAVRQRVTELHGIHSRSHMVQVVGVLGKALIKVGYFRLTAPILLIFYQFARKFRSHAPDPAGRVQSTNPIREQNKLRLKRRVSLKRWSSTLRRDPPSSAVTRRNQA